MLGFSLRNKVPNEKIRRRTQLTDVMVLWRRGVHSGVNKNKIDKKKKKINFKQPGRLLMLSLKVKVLVKVTLRKRLHYYY